MPTSLPSSTWPTTSTRATSTPPSRRSPRTPSTTIPLPDQGPGREGFRQFFLTLAGAFPDARIEPATIVADDEHVAIADTLTGTHRGELQGVAPTGKRIEARGVQIARFADGKIVERWGSSDELGIMRQLEG